MKYTQVPKGKKSAVFSFLLIFLSLAAGTSRGQLINTPRDIRDGIITYKKFATGAANSAVPVFDPRNFGAIPGDDLDDTNAFQNTIAAAALAKGGTILPGKGRYLFSGAGVRSGTTCIAIDGDLYPTTGADNISIIGERGTVFRRTDAAANRLIGVYEAKHIKISGIHFEGYKGGTLSQARSRDVFISIGDHSDDVEVSGNYMTGSLGDGVYIGGNPVDGSLLGYTPCNIKIFNNIIYTNYGNGILSSDEGDTGTRSRTAIAIVDAYNVDIYGNTFIGGIDEEINANYQATRSIHVHNNRFFSGPIRPQITIPAGSEWDEEPTVHNGGITLTAPSPSLSTSSTGGSLSNGTYYVRLTYANANGETPAGTEGSVTLSAGTATQKITVNGGAIPSPGASGSVSTVKIYISTASGMERYSGVSYGSGSSADVTALPSGAADTAPIYIDTYATITGSSAFGESTRNVVEDNDFDVGYCTTAGIYQAQIINNRFWLSGLIIVGSPSGGTTIGAVVKDNYFVAVRSGYNEAIQVIRTTNSQFVRNTLASGTGKTVFGLNNPSGFGSNTFRDNVNLSPTNTGVIGGYKQATDREINSFDATNNFTLFTNPYYFSNFPAAAPTFTNRNAVITIRRDAGDVTGDTGPRPVIDITHNAKGNDTAFRGTIGIRSQARDNPITVTAATAASPPAITVSGASRTGPGTVTASSSTLTGLGTNFQQVLEAGSTVTVSGQTRTIDSCSSDLSCTVTVAFSPAISTAATWTYNEKHGYATGNRVTLTGLGGMTEVNDRSFIVTKTGPYSFTLGETTGSGTVTTSGTSVAGTNTRFTSEVKVGDTITVSGQSKTVATVSSDSSLTVSSGFSPDVSGQTFTYTPVGTGYTAYTSGGRSGIKSVGIGGIFNVAPAFPRWNVPYDDMTGVEIQNDWDGVGSPATATDALYIGNNSLFPAGTNQWATGVTSGTSLGYFLRFTNGASTNSLLSVGSGVTLRQTAIDLYPATISADGDGSGFGTAMRVPNNTRFVSRNAAGTANVSLLRLNPSNYTQLHGLTKTGAGTLTTSGTAVTGLSTAFTAQLLPGDQITVAGQTRTIDTITDTNHLAVTVAFSPDITMGTAFTFAGGFGSIGTVQAGSSTGMVIGERSNAPLSTLDITANKNVLGGSGDPVESPQNYHLLLRRLDSTTGTGQAIGFVNSSSVGTIGAAIGYERTGANSIGELFIATKGLKNDGTTTEFPKRLRFTDDGRFLFVRPEPPASATKGQIQQGSDPVDDGLLAAGNYRTINAPSGYTGIFDAYQVNGATNYKVLYNGQIYGRGGVAAGFGPNSQSAQLITYDVTPIGTSAGDSRIMSDVSGSAGGSQFHKYQFLYNPSGVSGTWQGVLWEESIGIDNVRKTPGGSSASSVGTTTWFRRDPFNGAFSWGHFDSTFMGLSSAGLTTKRLISNGTALSGANWSQSGWGAGAVVTATGTDSAGTVTVTTDAADTPSANPTLTLTFGDGTWTTAPFGMAGWEDTSTGPIAQASAKTTATTLVIKYNGTPTATSALSYTFSYMVRR